jgi:hypothetical protein
MKTRQQYLNSECTHREYYSQFVNEGIKNLVRSGIGEKRIKESLPVDEHLNNIPLKEWDSLGAYIVSSPNVRAKIKEAGDGYSQAGAVCILKEAARQIAEE